MNIKFKIFRLEYLAVETFAGYSDGYGKEHEYHPVLKPAGFKILWKDDWNTKEEAVSAIKEYGDECSKYVIQKIYSK